jgi:cytochrome c oxidase assembly protein subunit 15
MHAAATNVMLPRWSNRPGVDCPRWLHVVAVLAVLAALPLLFLGAEVTTKGVGMADQRGLVNPVQALWEMMTGEQSLGWRIEHSHRLAGWLVGGCTIVLAVGMALWGPRGLRWLGFAAGCLVAIQGLLGIFRVNLHALFGSPLALVHGSFAQIVFATLVATALLTSARWRTAVGTTSTQARRLSLAVVGLLFVQVVLGGLIRHQGTLLAARIHLLGAFAVAAGLIWLIRLTWNEASLGAPARVIAGLLTLQIMFGVEAWMFWMRRAYVPLAGVQESAMVHWMRSGHYLLGALLFAATVCMALLAHRRAAIEPGEAAA